ncbi:hypothetical protein D7Y13_16845 [Corallococcus praedator]|uniref:Lipoprotein n=1 Tax=Corallococcus praedator TaxID=2316724 RepID=A0ABX9QHA3_9BACT|nr:MULTISPECIES: hypothetical protein [Corallococcus]RKH28255.1 hypothetical protein D7X75_25050 [Corallococcus sp. CA031C]RKI07987.1 hypothetical protein D7Y13_16845 [Corallococcus praedator]
MKMTTRCLVLLTLLAAMGCGDSNEGDGDTDGPPTSSALKCDAVGWCTTWTADGEDVTDAPPLTGGTLSDGLYRTERGIDSTMAWRIQGKSILVMSPVWRNRLGTWKVEGDRLIISLTSACSSSKDEVLSETSHYAFALKGDVLYTQELDFEDMPIMGWRKVKSLCDENASFNCKERDCACDMTTNTSLMGQPRCY